MTLEIIGVPRRRSYPPRVSAFTATFWEGLAHGRWMTTRCRACESRTFPPKVVCPRCWSQELEWTDMAVRGHLYSWTRIHAAPTAFAPEAPYAVGVVDLEDGLRLACRLIEPDDGAIAIGMAMEIIVLQYEDGPLFAARKRHGG